MSCLKASLEFFCPTALKVSLKQGPWPTACHCDPQQCIVLGNCYSVHIWWFKSIVSKEWFPIPDQGPTGSTRPLFNCKPHFNATRFVGSLLETKLKSPSLLHSQVNLLYLVSTTQVYPSPRPLRPAILQSSPFPMRDHSEYHADVWPIKLKHFQEKYNCRLTILEITQQRKRMIIWFDLAINGITVNTGRRKKTGRK